MNKFKKIVQTISQNMDTCLFIALALIAIVFSKLSNLSMEWTATGILIIFAGAYLRKKYTYLVGIFSALVIYFIITKNPLAYNYYFEIIMSFIIIGLIIIILEKLLKKIVEYLQKI